MLTLALTLMLFAVQPEDDGPVSTQQVIPPPSAAAMEEAKRRAEAEKVQNEEKRKAQQAEWEKMWAPPPPPHEPTEEEKRAAANRAALERAEQAGRDANAAPGAWPDEGKMRCKQTDTGFVCGNSDKAIEPGSPSRQALDDILKPN